jgi:HPt (histidine-containing phosphotransfer) domain-containing protein
MDFSKRADKLGLKEAELKEIIRLFIKTCLDDLSEYKAAAKLKDFQRAFTAIHSIKGAASTLGFHDISQIAMKIENQAKHRNIENLSCDATLLKHKINRLSDVIGS